MGRQFFDILHPDDLLIAQQALLAATFMKEPKTFETRVIRRDGITATMAWTAQWSDLDNAMLLVAQEGGMVQSGTVSKDAKEQFKDIMEALPVGLFLATSSGKIEIANKLLENSLEFGLRQLDERLVANIFPLKPPVRPGDSPLSAHIDTKCEMRVMSGKGREIPIELTVRRVSVGGLPMYLGHVQLVSERYEIQQIKQRLVETMQNEIKAPLAAIMMHIELTLEGVHGTLNEHGKRRAETILSDIQRMKDSIDAIIEGDSMESGNFQIATEPCDVMLLVKQALMPQLGDIRENELVLEINGADGVVMADEEKMNQVVETVLSNAIRFSPRGGKVRIQVVDKGDRMRVEVIDRGIGLSDEEQRAVFERFRQPNIDGEMTTGSGKSLLIAKHIVEKHAGQIGVISHKGAGSNFWFELPKAYEN